MKKRFKKISFIIFLFALVSGTFYFTPFLFKQEIKPFLNNDHILNFHQKLIQSNKNQIEKDYNLFVSKTTTNEINKLFPLFKSNLFIHSKINHIETQPLFKKYKIQDQNVVLIATPKTNLSNDTLEKELDKIKTHISNKLWISKNSNFKTIKLSTPSKKKYINMTKEQLCGLMFMISFILTLCFYAFPKILKQKKFKKTYKKLSSEAQSISQDNELAPLKNSLLGKVQSICHTTPDIALKNIRTGLTDQSLTKSKILFSPAQQTAILLTCLNKKTLKKIFKRMTDTEIKTIQSLTYSLGQITPEDKKLVLTNFLKQIQNPIQNTYQPLKTNPVLPAQRLYQILKEDKLIKTEKQVWQKLETLKCEKIAHFIEQEYPQTGAIILYHLSDEKAGTVLSLLSSEKSTLILLRLASLKQLTKEKLKIVETGLETYLPGFSKLPLYKGLKKAGRILSLMPQEKKEKLINQLSQKSSKTAQILSKKIICFDDFKNWDKKQIKKLIKKIPTDILLTALQNTNEQIKTVFASHIPLNCWNSFFEKLNKQETTDLKKIDEAQCFVIKQALDLSKKYKGSNTK